LFSSEFTSQVQIITLNFIH